MGFDIQRHRACQSLSVKSGKVLRRPAGAIRGAAGFVQRVQEFMPQKRVAAAQAIPLRGFYTCQGGYNLNGQG